jgi:hypothetical protein
MEVVPPSMFTNVRARILLWALVPGAVYLAVIAWLVHIPDTILTTREFVALLASVPLWGIVGGFAIKADGGWARVVSLAGIGTVVLLVALLAPIATNNTCSSAGGSCDTAAGAGAAVFAAPTYAVMAGAIALGRVARRITRRPHTAG